MEKLLPQIPVLTEYGMVKQELKDRIDKLNAIELLTEENKKQVKTSIAEINKVKDRIARYRIDNTNAFLKYIEPYTEQCKELEKMCTDGLVTIKAKVKDLEEKEKENKKILIKQIFDDNVQYCEFKDLLKFDMFFEPSMVNKSTSLTGLDTQNRKWLEDKAKDIRFIKHNVDEPDVVLAIYFKNGLVLTDAIAQYQERFKTESEIKAVMAANSTPPIAESSVEKKLDIILKIHNLPKSKVAALQAFLDNLKVEWEVEKA